MHHREQDIAFEKEVKIFLEKIDAYRTPAGRERNILSYEMSRDIQKWMSKIQDIPLDLSSMEESLK